MKRKSLLGLALAATMLAGPVTTAQTAYAKGEWPIFNSKATSGQALQVDPDRGVLTLAPLLEKVTPAVVNIRVKSKVKRPRLQFGGDPFNDEFLKRFFGDRANPFRDLPRRNRQNNDDDDVQYVQAAGSGVIINAAKGYILTNNHVIDKADKITVILKDRREAQAEVVGTDPKTDIALLKIKLGGLTDVPLADSETVKVGDYVIAIGNAFGIGQTVTSGIVSALGRSTFSRDQYQDYIQTDAAINQGNSGGALLNSKGELIGINAAIMSRSGGSNGIGFAVPTNMITKIMDQLIAYGEVRRGRIGVLIQNITPELQEAMNLPTRDGALISQVVADSPAEKAGLKVGDIIVGFNGETILDADDIRNAVGEVERDHRYKLTYLRDGKRHTTRIRVEAAPDDGTADTSGSSGGDETDPARFDALGGATFTNIPADLNPRGGKKGVLVERVKRGSDAWEAGLQRGDIVRSVNNVEISNLADFKREIARKKGAIFLSVQRGRNQVFIAIK